MDNADQTIKSNDFIKSLTEQYLFHKQAYERLRDLLELYGALPKNGNEVPIKHEVKEVSHHTDATPKIIFTSKYNFNDFIIDLFKDGKPKITKEIMQEFTRQTGKKIDLKNFSSKLNTVRQRKDGRINNIGYLNLPLDRRFWWGLSDWFDESGDFKPEYKRKIPDINK